ncbi:hypothetical protein CEXT_22001 [Caerostris extrusa]|uniref:Uncharacterized protein n=1 Tax=Caerostris extrusa TaxID=172846 RepID=A0AAV4MIJ5_CAEEX|nr:hypothetical protein CEXT_22001 [Caerostris extrusa]
MRKKNLRGNYNDNDEKPVPKSRANKNDFHNATTPFDESSFDPNETVSYNAVLKHNDNVFSSSKFDEDNNLSDEEEDIMDSLIKRINLEHLDDFPLPTENSETVTNKTENYKLTTSNDSKLVIKDYFINALNSEQEKSPPEKNDLILSSTNLDSSFIIKTRTERDLSGIGVEKLTENPYLKSEKYATMTEMDSSVFEPERDSEKHEDHSDVGISLKKEKQEVVSTFKDLSNSSYVKIKTIENGNLNIENNDNKYDEDKNYAPTSSEETNFKNLIEIPKTNSEQIHINSEEDTLQSGKTTEDAHTVRKEPNKSATIGSFSVVTLDRLYIEIEQLKKDTKTIYPLEVTTEMFPFDFRNREDNFPITTANDLSSGIRNREDNLPITTANELPSGIRNRKIIYQ